MTAVDLATVGQRELAIAPPAIPAGWGRRDSQSLSRALPCAALPRAPNLIVPSRDEGRCARHTDSFGVSHFLALDSARVVGGAESARHPRQPAALDFAWEFFGMLAPEGDVTLVAAATGSVFTDDLFAAVGNALLDHSISQVSGDPQDLGTWGSPCPGSDPGLRPSYRVGLCPIYPIGSEGGGILHR